MGANGGRHHASVIRRLRLETHRFDFHQAVRVLEAAVPGATPVGTGSTPAREVVRFRGAIGGGFPPSDLASLHLDDDPDAPPELTVNFLGLAGAMGPLPPPLAELVQQRLRAGDSAPRDFLDIFNHRLISLIARIRRAHRPALQPGQPDEGAFAAPLFALLGLLTPGLRRASGRQGYSRLGGLDAGLPFHAGLLNQRPVSLHAIERLLSSHFAHPFRAVPLVGGWLTLDDDRATILRRPRGDGQDHTLRLGQGAVLGRRAWDQSAGIRLESAPLTFARMVTFLPGAKAHDALRTLVGFQSGGGLDVSLTLTLPPEEVPATRLSHDPEQAARLGWTSFLTTRPRTAPGVVSVPVTQGEDRTSSPQARAAPDQSNPRSLAR